MHEVFGNRFYGHRQPGWHKLGFVTQEPLTAMETLTLIGGGHIVEKYPNYAFINGEYVPTGDYVIVRQPLPDDPFLRFFGHATERYEVLSSLEVAELFDEKVSTNVETMGFLGNGERMFVTWELPSFEVVKDDTIRTFGFIATGFDSLMGTSLNVVTVRVVCANTWRAAINQAENTKERGKGRIWSSKHTSKNMKYKLGEWMSHVQTDAQRQANLTQDFFAKLVEKKIDDVKEVERLVYAAYPDPEKPSDWMPENLKPEEWDKYEKNRQTVENDRNGIMAMFDGGTEITPDYYGLFNATTEWFNYGKMAKKPVEYSIVMGNRANAMDKMAEVLSYEVSK